MKTLVDWVKRICEPQFLNEELWHLEQVLQVNSYSLGEVRHPVWLRRSARLVESVLQGTVSFSVLPLYSWVYSVQTTLVGC